VDRSRPQAIDTFGSWCDIERTLRLKLLHGDGDPRPPWHPSIKPKALPQRRICQDKKSAALADAALFEQAAVTDERLEEHQS
jgi:hypothetical protein